MKRTSQNDKPGNPWLRNIIILCSLLGWLLPVSNTLAQETPITASVNNISYKTDELVVLTVTVVDDSPQQPRPVLPPLNGLAVVDLDIATSVRLIDNKIHTEVIYTYRLQPRRTGTLEIPPIPVKIDDRVFRTGALSIDVTQGEPPAPSPENSVKPESIEIPTGLVGQDFFVEAVVDTKSPFVGQQLIYIFRFYQAIHVYRKPQFEMPRFNGFDTVGLPVQEYNMDAADRTYLVSEIRTALFPKLSGKLKISSAQLMFPGTFFEPPSELFTDPIVLQVKDLPDDAPPLFSGAVGQFEMRSWMSPQTPAVDQPARLYVAVSGSGNIYKQPEPTWPTLKEWRVYNTQASLSVDHESGSVGGTRVYERLMVAGRPGEVIIQPVTLVYFDPVSARYEMLSTEPLVVQINPAPTPSPATATPIASANLPDTTPLDTPPVSSAEIVNPEASTLPLGLAWPLMVMLVGALCAAVPLAAIGGAAGIWAWQQRQKAPVSALQMPTEQMHPALATTMQQQANSFKVVQHALEQYLSEKLQTPVRGLTRPELTTRLKKHNLPPDLIEQVQSTLDKSEQGRYAPQNVDSDWELVSQADKLLARLEKLWSDSSS